MIGIILAAGRGSRMGSLTDNQPKCLTELAGRSLLDWQLTALGAAGIEQIVVVRGYYREALSGPGYDVRDNERWADSNMVVTLTAADDVLRRDDCLVSYSDIVYHPDAVCALAADRHDVAIAYDRHWQALWQGRFEDPLADAEIFRQRRGRLLEIGARTARADEIEGQYMGLLKFTPAGWQGVSELLAGLAEAERDRLDMTALLSRLLAAGTAIGAVAVEGSWCEVDSETDLRFYQEKIAAAEAWSHDWRW
ncbi:MAG TPA: phosphocholine cytidylyltransferase family protein [Alphaproteobacteria bacterium]|jgi:choline kinase|nr:transferase [Dehalococcoidales bacterium]MDP6068673.1 phosphocholine cytidylyltransferase family protein [Alphaproteobacteria bacterium]MDP6271744.1 phosphocholine cytidylyltransferase family protein [Alphaproteobacteria bacterium]MDP7427476.1 phosphocholine cytidylyltransferase family protein [Alphaproteobacteria bacterium]HJM49884.1 phosphocholine cytidylyltransferase family protein [Alphaproteobacteria bacterium]